MTTLVDAPAEARRAASTAARRSLEDGAAARRGPGLRRRVLDDLAAGRVGAIERTERPFADWLRESTLCLPVFVFAVLAALTLALHWFGTDGGRDQDGAVPRAADRRRRHARRRGRARGQCGLRLPPAVRPAARHARSTMRRPLRHEPAWRRRIGDSLALQVRGVLLVSRWILLTNLVLVAWVVAHHGRSAEAQHSPARTGVAEPERGHRSRVQQIRLLLVGGPGRQRRHPRGRHSRAPRRVDRRRAVLHPAHRRGARRRRSAARARTTTHSTARRRGDLRRAAPSLAVLTYRGPAVRTGGGHSRGVGVPDCLACSLEVGSLLAALALLRSTRWLAGRSPASSHVHGLVVVALVCMTVIGVGGSGLSWFDAFGTSASHSATGMHH